MTGGTVHLRPAAPQPEGEHAPAPAKRKQRAPLAGPLPGTVPGPQQPAARVTDVAGRAAQRALPKGPPPPPQPIASEHTFTAGSTPLPPVAIQRGCQTVQDVARGLPHLDGPPSPTETLAQEYVEEAISDLAGEHHGYPSMSVDVMGTTYTVEQRGDKMRVTGPNAGQPGVLSAVLKIAQKLNMNPETAVEGFDQDIFDKCIASAGRGNITIFSPQEQREARMLAKAALFKGGFVDTIGDTEGIGGTERARGLVNERFDQIGTRAATSRAMSRTGDPATPRPKLTEDDRKAFGTVIRYLRKNPDDDAFQQSAARRHFASEGSAPRPRATPAALPPPEPQHPSRAHEAAAAQRAAPAHGPIDSFKNAPIGLTYEPTLFKGPWDNPSFRRTYLDALDRTQPGPGPKSKDSMHFAYAYTLVVYHEAAVRGNPFSKDVERKALGVAGNFQQRCSGPGVTVAAEFYNLIQQGFPNVVQQSPPRPHARARAFESEQPAPRAVRPMQPEGPPIEELEDGAPAPGPQQVEQEDTPPAPDPNLLSPDFPRAAFENPVFNDTFNTAFENGPHSVRISVSNWTPEQSAQFAFAYAAYTVRGTPENDAGTFAHRFVNELSAVQEPKEKKALIEKLLTHPPLEQTEEGEDMPGEDVSPALVPSDDLGPEYLPPHEGLPADFPVTRLNDPQFAATYKAKLEEPGLFFSDTSKAQQFAFAYAAYISKHPLPPGATDDIVHRQTDQAGNFARDILGHLEVAPQDIRPGIISQLVPPRVGPRYFTSQSSEQLDFKPDHLAPEERVLPLEEEDTIEELDEGEPPQPEQLENPEEEGGSPSLTPLPKTVPEDVLNPERPASEPPPELNLPSDFTAAWDTPFKEAFDEASNDVFVTVGFLSGQNEKDAFAFAYAAYKTTNQSTPREASSFAAITYPIILSTPEGSRGELISSLFKRQSKAPPSPP